MCVCVCVCACVCVCCACVHACVVRVCVCVRTHVQTCEHKHKEGPLILSAFLTSHRLAYGVLNLVWDPRLFAQVKPHFRLCTELVHVLSACAAGPGEAKLDIICSQFSNSRVFLSTCHAKQTASVHYVSTFPNPSKQVL